MGMVLMLLGVAFFVVLVGAGLFIFFIRKKWDKIKALAEESPMPPMRIHLNEDLDPVWTNEKEAQVLVNDLEATGFSKGIAYEIPEMPEVRLLSFFSDQETISAVLYKHGQGFFWIDMGLAYEDDTDLGASSAPAGGEMDRRPGKQLISLPKASVRELYAALAENIEPKGLKTINNDNFRTFFESEYEKDMAWRMQKGGVSEEEFMRIAQNSHTHLNEETLHEVFVESKRKELNSWHDTCIEAALEEKGVPREKWDDFKHQYFIVSDKMHPEAFLQYLDDYMDFAGQSMENFKNLISDIQKTRDLFSRINDTLTPDLKAKKVGQVDLPIIAEIYEAPVPGN